MIEYKYRLIVGLLVLFVLTVPVWMYHNRHYVLQRIFPFHSLENKVAVDDIDILEWIAHPDIGEVYLADTVSHTIRQLTYDNFLDQCPAVSIDENRVYFLSYRPSDSDQDYPDRQRRLYYFDLDDQEIHLCGAEFESILRGPTSDIASICISDGKMALVEYYDSATLYLIDLESKVLISHWQVDRPAVIVSFEDGWITIRENGKTEKYATDRIATCETIYSNVDEIPEFNGGISGLMDYFARHLLPVISECAGEDKVLTTRLTIVLTIDVNGNVVDAELSDHHLTADCATQSSTQLIGMAGWSPGRLEGQPTCSRFGWTVRGIKWNAP